MPLNYLQIKPQMDQYVAAAKLHQQELEEKLALALQLLKSCAANHETAARHVREFLSAQSPRPRSGIPSDERVDLAKDCPPGDIQYQIAASDGSQITPSAHDEVSVGLINTSLISYSPGSGLSPSVEVHSNFIRDAAGNIEMGNISEDLISLQRDLAEIRILTEWQTESGLPVITLGDGPLELFHQPRVNESFTSIFEKYRTAMQEMAGKEVILAGYTDKPRAGLITRMLSVSGEKEIDLSGLEDTILFNHFLQPGQRSAIFELFSSASDLYTGDIKLHFSYLQVGRVGHPWTVRVEIPAVVARDQEKVDLLHRALLAQCHLMGNRPYPYILHRAHEEALVGLDEKEQLIHHLAVAMRKKEVLFDGKSYKQTAKDLEKRTRMGK